MSLLTQLYMNLVDDLRLLSTKNCPIFCILTSLITLVVKGSIPASLLIFYYKGGFLLKKIYHLKASIFVKEKWN